MPIPEPLRRAVRVSQLSVAVAAVLAALALVFAADSGSLALAAFGLENAIDGAASAVLVWRFHTERRSPHRAEDVERIARRLIAFALLVITVYLVVAAVHALITDARTKDSAGAVILAAISVAVLPAIAHRKRSLARQLRSRALRADSLLTGVAAVLAVVTLVAIALDRYANLSVADPVAALVIAAVLVREAIGALRE
jgi:divalent metal cation (Fe/Co/Zn/Cd) transporter